MSRLIDLTGKRFGNLVVVGRVENGTRNRPRWLCKCDCGRDTIVYGMYLRDGETTSCGCMKYKLISNSESIDISGKQYNWLLPLYPVKDGKGPRKWHCECLLCGGSSDIITNAIVSGITKSCGCLRKKVIHDKMFKDLTGRKFDRLYVDHLIGKTKGRYYYHCICDCGKTIDVQACHLRDGFTRSCGCLRSATEYEMTDIFDRLGINYQKQKSFIGCRDIGPLRFDFYLPDYNLAIEYDGQMHYQETSLGNDLEGQQRRDAIKTKYCEENDIILLRIPYWEKDNIESILSDWLFLNTGE